jgi:hypothetical protein
MKTSFHSFERGQGFVIAALMLMALIGILALTIDGGLTYLQRRQAQNAADAAALAGARVMCMGGGNPVTVAREYANRNGIQDVNTNVQVLASTTGTVNSVIVTTTIPYDTFFAGIIGIQDAEVGATAEAACYLPCSSGGVLPIAWSCKAPTGGSISSDCDVVPQDADGCQWGDDQMYIIADDIPIGDEILCQDPAAPDPSLVDCDLDDDGTNDLDVLSGANRAWLDLDGGSSNADELKDWIDNPATVPPVRVHSWFSGATGTKDTVFSAIRTNYLNDDVVIPVFDMYDSIKNGETPAPFHTGDLFLDSGAGDYFHVITFAVFHITCVDDGSTGLCPAKNELVGQGFLKPNTKTVEGCFQKKLFEGSGLPGACNIDAGGFVLKLVR